jgi:hypothetical protein
LQEDVLPWLFSKVDMFLEDDEFVSQNTFDAIEAGIHLKQQQHLAKLQEVER